MGQVRLAFDGQCRTPSWRDGIVLHDRWRTPYTGYGFVVRADGLLVGRGWGAADARMSRLRAALLALERGLEFIAHSDLIHQSIIVQSDVPGVGTAILAPPKAGGRPVVSEHLAELLGQCDALRVMRIDPRENGASHALAHLGWAQFEHRRRTFDVCDDDGLMEYLRGGAGRGESGGASEPLVPWTDSYFALPFNAERLRKILDGLRFREREMIKLRNPKAGERVYKQSEIAQVFRLSHERVRQILIRGMRRLWTLAARAEPWR